MGLSIKGSKDVNKLKQDIKALEFQLQHDTTKKDIKIHTAALKHLREGLLYKEYLAMQSKEFKEDVIGYERLVMPGADISIRVNFKWGWLRVYRTKAGIEWY